MTTPTFRAASQDGDKPLVVLVSSGYHLYREYLLAQVAAAARVWLFLSAEPTWEKRYIVGHTLVDTLDPPAMITAARELAETREIAGALCWDEVRMVQTAQFQEALGLPGSTPEAVTSCRDKHLTRAALAAAGVPQAASVLVSSLDEAHKAAEHIGYPVICKPRALGASFGVNGVDSPDGLAAGYAEARGATEDGVPYYDAGVLIEEYLTGEEISVDCAVEDGKLTALFLARKVSGFPPYFEETGHTVDAADPLLDDPDLLAVLEQAHRAVGYHRGVTHTELRLTAAGPKVIEINARLGGDLIPYVASIASGTDPGAAAVRVACGRPVDPAPRQGRVAAVHFLYPDEDCVVEDVTVDEAALPEAVRTVGVLAARGQELLLPPAGHVTSRYAYMVVAGDNLDACDAAVDRARRAVRLRPQDRSAP